ncbi:hypothetical protein CHARACLAT_028756 [Characodon lateralis]|uniref:Uncharacterized protein n=1 Tax=Characodon lateralis TaxID=208331 RepID=A0ABU7EDP1_9TELE|nr:hypothetical protein [Characodon lateralis]
MLAVDVSPSHGDTLRRVCVYIWRVEGWTRPVLDTSAWIGSAQHEDRGNIRRNRGPNDHSLFLSNLMFEWTDMPAIGKANQREK